MIDFFYFFILIVVLFGVALCVYRQFDKETMYFRFSCENIFDIDYYDYVVNYKFFNFFNEQLSEHLKLYVQSQFHALGVPYQNLHVSTQIEFETVTIACYLEINRRKHDFIQEKIIKSVNLETEIRRFYTFCEQVREPEYHTVFHLKEIAEK